MTLKGGFIMRCCETVAVLVFITVLKGADALGGGITKWGDGDGHNLAPKQFARMSSLRGDRRLDSSPNADPQIQCELLAASDVVEVNTAAELTEASRVAGLSCTNQKKDCIARLDVELNGELDCTEGPVLIGDNQCVFVKGKGGGSGFIPEECAVFVSKETTVVLGFSVYLGGSMYALDPSKSDYTDPDDHKYNKASFVVDGGYVNAMHCPPSWITDPKSEKCFAIASSSQTIDYDSAEALCLKLDPHSTPAKIDSKYENDVATKLLERLDVAWLSSDADDRKYYNWAKDEKPKSEKGSVEEVCPLLLEDGTWLSETCDEANARHVVCSIPKHVPFYPTDAVTSKNSAKWLVKNLNEFNHITDRHEFDFDDYDSTTTVVFVMLPKRDDEFPEAHLHKLLNYKELQLKVSTQTPSELLEVGVDTEKKVLKDKYYEWEGNTLSVPVGKSKKTLPVLAFIHAEEEVCVTDVGLYADGDLVVGIPIPDMAMCDSPVFEYDHENGCVRLRQGLSRDLAVDLDSTDCLRVSLERNTDFMERLLFEVEGENLDELGFASQLSNIDMTPGDYIDHLLRFPSRIKIWKQTETFQSTLRRVKITAYDVPLVEWEPSITFLSLDTCPPFAGESALYFGSPPDSPDQIGLTEVVLNMIESGYEMIDKSTLGNVSGADACTFYVDVDHSNIDMVQSHVDALVVDYMKRTLHLTMVTNEVEMSNETSTSNETSSFRLPYPPLNVAVPRDVRLEVVASFDGYEIPPLRDASIVVDEYGQALLYGLTLDGNVAVNNFGNMSLEASTVEVKEGLEVLNGGYIEIAGSELGGAGRLLANLGLAELKSVTIPESDGAIIDNSGSLSFLGNDIFDDLFQITGGSSAEFVFKDSESLFARASSLHAACASDVSKLAPTEDLKEVSTLDECQALCEPNDDCVAVWFNNDPRDEGFFDTGAWCGLCLRTGSCGFNCTKPGSILMEKKDVVQATGIGESYCSPYAPHETPGVNTSLWELADCRGWCSTFNFCDAFSYVEGVCEFFDGPEIVRCGANDVSRQFYVLENHDDAFGNFAQLPAGYCMSADGLLELTDLPALSTAEDCAAFCGAYSDCAAFEADTSWAPCKFYSWLSTVGTFDCDGSDTVYLSMADSQFPLAGNAERDTLKFDCTLDTSLSQNQFLTGGVDACKAECNKDPLCAAFTVFPASARTGEPDCFIWYPEYLDGLWDTKRCTKQDGKGETYLVHTQQDFLEISPNMTTPELPCPGEKLGPIPGAWTVAECKAVCLRTEGCEMFAFLSDVAPKERCHLTCSPNSTVIEATHVKTIIPSNLSYTSYVVADVCDPPTSTIFPVNAADTTQDLVSACRIMCDVSSPCVAYQTQTISGGSGCTMYNAFEVEPISGGACASGLEEVHVAYKGKRAFNFFPAPSRSNFVVEGIEATNSSGSAKMCLDACIASDTCQAATVDWTVGGKCKLYSSSSFESSDGLVEDDFKVFVRYSRFFYYEASNGAEYGGMDDLNTFFPMVETRKACTQLCSITRGCGSVEFDSALQTCKLMGGGNVVSENKEGSVPVFVDQVQVNPFVELDGVNKQEVCPQGLLFSATQVEVQACQALCMSVIDCGSISYNRNTNTCNLFSSKEFLGSSCDWVEDDDRFFLSYLHFLVRDARSGASLSSSVLNGETLLCLVNGTEISTHNETISEAACLIRCSATPECAVYSYNSDTRDCTLMKDSSELEPCSEAPEYLGLAFRQTAFEHNEECLYYGKSQLASFPALREAPECAAICEAYDECWAFQMTRESECQLFASAVTKSCSDEDPTIATYTYFSDRAYTAVGASYCVASNDKLTSLELGLEACKLVCDMTTGCAAIVHDLTGNECVLYRSRDFVSCPASSRSLYISAKRLAGLTESPDEMAELSDACMVYQDPSETQSCESSCSLGQACEEDSDCRSPLSCQEVQGLHFGAFFDQPTKMCHLHESKSVRDCETECMVDIECEGILSLDGKCSGMSAADLARVEPSYNCDGAVSEVRIKYPKNAYRATVDACLKNPLTSRSIGPFAHTDLTNCMNLCGSHSLCRHFTLSASDDCELYEAQIGGVDTGCSLPEGTDAYINSRSFIDSVQYMGVPERVFAEIPRLTYQECAAVCNELENCGAFLHDWGYRQSEEYLDVTFEPQRLVTKLGGNSQAKVLTVSRDEMVTVAAMIDVSDYSDQRILLEKVSGSKEKVRLRFRAFNLCLGVLQSDVSVTALDCLAGGDEMEWTKVEETDGFLSFRMRGLCLAWDVSDSLSLQDCSGEMIKWDEASGPVRLSSESAPDMCLESDRDTGVVSMAACSTRENEQLFTYLYRAKRFISQRQYVSGEGRPYTRYHLTNKCVEGPDLEVPFQVPNLKACQKACDAFAGCFAIEYLEKSLASQADYGNMKIEMDVCRLKGSFRYVEDCNNWDMYYTFGEYQVGHDGKCLSNLLVDGSNATNLISTEAMYWDDCMNTCDSMDGCIGFEYCDLPGEELSLDGAAKEGFSDWSLDNPNMVYGCEVLRPKLVEPSCTGVNNPASYCGTCNNDALRVDGWECRSQCSKCSTCDQLTSACELCDECDYCLGGKLYMASNVSTASCFDGCLDMNACSVCDAWESLFEAYESTFPKCSACENIDPNENACQLCDQCQDSTCLGCLESGICDDPGFCEWTLTSWKDTISLSQSDSKPVCLFRTSQPAVEDNCNLTSTASNSFFSFERVERRLTVDEDKCLTFNGVTIKSVPCADVEVDATLLPGNKIQWGSDGCLVYKDPDQATVETCGDSAAQTWDRYAVCRLTTYTQTPPILLESADSPNMCFAMQATEGKGSCRSNEEDSVSDDSAGLARCSTSEASVLQYTFNGDEGYKIRNFLEPNQCIAQKPQNSTDVFSEGSVYWEDCDSKGSKTIGLNWVLRDGMQFDSARNQSLVYLSCSGRVLSLSNTRMMGSTDFSKGQFWRKFGSSGGVELAIRPDLAEIKFTDPELTFQLWFWSDLGLKSRNFLAKLEFVSEASDKLSHYLSLADSAVDKVSNSFLDTMSYTDPLTDTLGKIVDFGGLLVPILMLLEKVPYVGPVIKGIQLRNIVKNVKSTLDKSKSSLGKLDKAIGGSESIIVKLRDYLDPLKYALVGLPDFFEVAGNLIVRLVRCSVVEEKKILEEQLNSLMDAIGGSVDFLQTAVDELSDFMKSLVDFRIEVERVVLKPFKALNSLFSPVMTVVDALEFLLAIFLYVITLGYPGSVKFRCHSVIPWDVDFSIDWSLFEQTLESIADFIGDVERIIRNIPPIKFVLGIVEEAIDTILSTLFPETLIPLPGMGFLSKFNLFDPVEDMINDIYKVAEEKVLGAMDVATRWFSGLTDTFDAVSISDFVNTEFPNLTLPEFCPEDDLGCYALSMPIPGIDTEGLEDLVDFIQEKGAAAQAAMEETEGFIETFLSGLECKGSAPLKLQGLDGIPRALGLGLNDSDCSELLENVIPEFEVCTEFGLSESATEALSSVVNILNDAGKSVDDERMLRRALRSLDAKDSLKDFKLAFTVTLPLRKWLECMPRLGLVLYPHLGKAFSSFRRDKFTTKFIHSGKAKQLVKNILGKQLDPIEPYGVDFTPSTGEVFAITFAFDPFEWKVNDATSFNFKIAAGFRVQLQLVTSFHRDWYSVAQKLIGELSTEYERSLSVQENCKYDLGEGSFWSLGKNLCDRMKDFMDGMMNAIEEYSGTGSYTDIETLVGDKSKWSKLTKGEKRDVNDWLDRSTKRLEDYKKNRNMLYNKYDRTRLEKLRDWKDTALASRGAVCSKEKESHRKNPVTRDDQFLAQAWKFATGVGVARTFVDTTFLQVRFKRKPPEIKVKGFELVTPFYGFQVHIPKPTWSWSEKLFSGYKRGLVIRKDFYMGTSEDDVYGNIAVMLPKVQLGWGSLGFTLHTGVGLPIMKLCFNATTQELRQSGDGCEAYDDVF